MESKTLTKGFFVTGTDTGVGKTVASLGLCLTLKADYWKPVQTGVPTDSDYINQFLPKERIHSSSFQFKEPLSPNQSAELENSKIDLNQIKYPSAPFLVVEGIGGVLVPLNNKHTVLDLIKKLDFPVIIVARTGLGTLNHTFLTIEALKNRNTPIAGLILSGTPHSRNKKDLESLTEVPIILELDYLEDITEENLIESFEKLNLDF